MTNDIVSRKKYEELKEKAIGWKESSMEYKNLYEDLLDENERLNMENEDISKLENEINCLNTNIEKYIENEICLQQDIAKLEDEVNKYKQRYKEAHKKIREWEKKNEMKSIVDELVSKRLCKDI